MKASLSEKSADIPVPEDLTPEQATIFRKLYERTKWKGSHFPEVAIDILARHPDLMSQYVERSRKIAIQKVAVHLSDTKAILDLPPELLATMLRIPSSEIIKYATAVKEIRQIGIELSTQDAKLAIDLAKVHHVMEEDRFRMAPKDAGDQEEAGVAFPSYEEDIGDADPNDRFDELLSD